MQEDMHYYGTYAMARAAGLKKDICKTIATAAQFVDDNAKRGSIVYKDNGRLDISATAHHSIDKDNLNKKDQRQIWVPFHFLPGNEGDTFEEKLICRENSDIVNEMLEYVISQSNKTYGIALIGIAAHVYADTFSHQGFSGISSNYNKTRDLGKGAKTKQTKKKEIRLSANGERKFEQTDDLDGDAMAADLAERLSNGLGHGGVNDYPDRPYLHWHFEYEPFEGRKATFNEILNIGRFVKGCSSLHKFFLNVAGILPESTDTEACLFADIEPIVEAILKTEGECEERAKEWQDRFGELMKDNSETIPKYDANKWLNELKKDRNKTEAHNYLGTDAYHFFQAGSIYRNYVLRELLPKHGLMVA
ncbi:MAG: hypothetical protein GY804_01880 [Alphaproteobacteria bacterium]|nr:hypothetical protein [Alphaproteobacteria bacterium]